jgi:hypothetical protein
MAEQHTILGGKVYVYKRPDSTRWQCSSYFAGKNRRTSTKEESLAKAKDVAEDWYVQLRGKLRTGELKAEKTFREVSEHFLRECEIMTCGERSKQYVKGQSLRSLHPEKTRLLEFGRCAMGKAKRQGRKPDTFAFLGFTHICAQSRKGTFTVHVGTITSITDDRRTIRVS